MHRQYVPLSSELAAGNAERRSLSMQTLLAVDEWGLRSQEPHKTCLHWWWGTLREPSGWKLFKAYLPWVWQEEPAKPSQELVLGSKTKASSSEQAVSKDKRSLMDPLWFSPLVYSNFQHGQICRYLNPAYGAMGRQDRSLYKPEESPSVAEKNRNVKRGGLTPCKTIGAAPDALTNVISGHYKVTTAVMPIETLVAINTRQWEGSVPFPELFWLLRDDSLGPGMAAPTRWLSTIWVLWPTQTWLLSTIQQGVVVVRISDWDLGGPGSNSQSIVEAHCVTSAWSHPPNLTYLMVLLWR